MVFKIIVSLRISYNEPASAVQSTCACGRHWSVVPPGVRSRRPHTLSPSYNASLSAGIINSEGRLWKSQRRFLHDKLREFGMTYMGNGKKIMEGRIKVCYHYFHITT